MKIYQKVIVYSLLIITLPLLTMSAVLYFRTRGTVEDELVASYGNVVDVYLNNLLHKSQVYEDLMEHLMTSDALSSIVANQAPISPGSIAAGRTFDEDLLRRLSVDMREEVYLVSIYTDNVRAAVVSDYVVEYTYAQQPGPDELAEIRENALRPVYRVHQTPGLGRTVISILGPALGYDSDTLFSRTAVIQIDVLAWEFLTNAMPSDYRNPEFGVYVFSDTGVSVFARPVEEVETLDLWTTIQGNPDDEGGTAAIRVSNGFVLLPSEAPFGLRYAFVFPMGELREKLTATLLQMGVLYVVVVAAFVMISVGLTRPYKERLRQLIGKINAIKQGDLRCDRAVGGRDEISLVDSHLSEMVVRLRELLTTVYEEELELKEAQLTALESQINPHFLFNTLELINSIASVHDDDEICAITEKLGRMLRYNLDSSSSHWATVQEEFSNVRDYLAIHQLRFDGSFTVYLDLDPAALRTQVPRFILQPLVENSMKHGFANTPRGRALRLSAHLEDDSLRLVVVDNGVGMSEEQQAELNAFMRDAVSNRHLHPKRGERIGLQNVFMRLLLTHGEAFHMSITSDIGEGTTVTVITPIKTAESRHVQATDR